MEIKQELERYKLNKQSGIFVDEEIREAQNSFSAHASNDDNSKSAPRRIQASGSPKSPKSFSYRFP